MFELPTDFNINCPADQHLRRCPGFFYNVFSGNALISIKFGKSICLQLFSLAAFGRAAQLLTTSGCTVGLVYVATIDNQLIKYKY